MPDQPVTARPTAVHTVICANCGAATPEGDPHCDCCGAHLVLLEPLAVDCGWCGRHNRREQTAHCVTCGGPLPALPGGEPGPRPPDTPRVLPSGYRNRVMIWKNVLVIIGFVFTVPFCWSILFPMIGIPLWYFGWRRGREKLAALLDGRATRGRITSVSVDYSETINNQHPWSVAYTYALPDGTEISDAVQAWDPVNARRSKDDAVWVVHSSFRDRACSAIWPPIR